MTQMKVIDTVVFPNVV